MKKEMMYKTCLLGAAIGDALSYPFRFKSTSEKSSENWIRSYTEYRDGVGRIGSKTQILLFNCEGILRATNRASIKGISGSEAILAAYALFRWMLSQDLYIDPKKINMGTNKIEDGYLITRKDLLFDKRDPDKVLMESLKSGFIHDTENLPNDINSGIPLTRIAPVAFMFRFDPVLAFRNSMTNAALTHGHRNSLLSAGFLGTVFCFLDNGYSLFDAIKEARFILMDSGREFMDVISALAIMYEVLNERKKDDIRKEDLMLFVDPEKAENCLAISLLFALKYEKNFEDGIINALNLTEKNPVITMLTGSLLGFINPAESIPERFWNLREIHLIDEIGEDLGIRTKSFTDGPQDPFWSMKYPPF